MHILAAIICYSSAVRANFLIKCVDSCFYTLFINQLINYRFVAFFFLIFLIHMFTQFVNLLAYLILNKIYFLKIV